jgi:hypothetical protein
VTAAAPQNNVLHPNVARLKRVRNDIVRPTFGRHRGRRRVGNRWSGFGLAAHQPTEQNRKLHIVNVLNANADGVLEAAAEQKERNRQFILFLPNEGIPVKIQHKSKKKKKKIQHQID